MGSIVNKTWVYLTVNALCLNPASGWDLSVWSFHVLTVNARVPSGYSDMPIISVQTCTTISKFPKQSKILWNSGKDS